MHDYRKILTLLHSGLYSYLEGQEVLLLVLAFILSLWDQQMRMDGCAGFLELLLII